MTHSKMFNKVKNWFINGRPIQWIKNAVARGQITTEEYKEITGEDYDE